MTLTTIFRSVLGSSGAQYQDYPTASQSHKFLSEKNGEYYYYKPHKKTKGKSKTDKKHAILSALSLLAFLFFLNILQNCIREQNINRGTSMMFAPSGPTAHQGKEPNPTQDSQSLENGFRKKRSAESPANNKSVPKGDGGVGRKSRNLLGLPQMLLPVSRETTPNTNRQMKFIKNYSNVNNWTSELSQVSDKDLEDQKLKTLNFPLYWKNNRFVTPEIAASPSIVVGGKIVGSTDKVPPLLRRIKKRERTTLTPELIQNINRTRAILNSTAQRVVWENPNPIRHKNILNKPYKNMRLAWYYNKTHGYQPYQPNVAWNSNNTKSNQLNTNWNYNRTQNYHPPSITWNHTTKSYQTDGGWKGYTRSQIGNGTATQLVRETTTAGVTRNTATTQNVLSVPDLVATTPRNRRSDYMSTPRSSDYDDYDRYGDQNREDGPISPTPAVGLDLNTFQTFPVYNYYNHRPNGGFYRENDTVDVVTPDSIGKPDVTEIDRMHNEPMRVTTEQPLFYPTKMSPPYTKHPYYDKIKYRNRYPNHHGYHYHMRNHYPAESRYRYSPYRKVGAYEPTHFHDPLHDDYHVVLAKYPQDEEPGFDIMKFLWSMFTSVARPLTKLVPSFAKESTEEPQCYDLLVCEAQRMSKFMGPTAEALTTTLGTLLTWAATEETRQVVVDALNSGRENTCQQQIRDCEDRSGGKSAMTVIAQVMEMRLR